MHSQKGFAPAVLILLAALGVVVFILFSSTFPFKDKLFGLLYPKPSSKAAEPATPVPVLSLKYFPVTPCYNPIQKLDMTGATASSPDANYGPPQNAIDGNILATKWQPVSSSRGVSLQIDFGTVKTFKAITPYFYDFNQPQSYHFSASQDGVNWTTVVTETNSLQGFTQYTAGSPIQRKNYFIDPVTARYIKFVIDQYINSDPSASGQVNMYELEFYADKETKECLDFNEVGQEVYDGGIRSDSSMPDPLSSARERTQKINLETMAFLDKGSIYHGYKDPTATPSLAYQMFEEKEFHTPVPKLGGYADHVKILNNLNICNYVENLGVKEVWLWMYHTSTVAPVESYQTGPNHQAGNGYMNLPVCKKSYTVYDYSLSRGTSETIEDHTHHIEHLWESLDAEAEALYQLFTNEQDEFKPNNLSLPLHCGWTHCPPNVIISPNNCNPTTNVCYCEGYNWESERIVESDCENWKPDGTGVKTSVSCHTWYGQDKACIKNGGIEFKVWWMQNIPGKNNGLTYNGKAIKNWWDFIGNFDAAIASGKRLTSPLPTPTPSPTPTPKPSPTSTPAPTPTPPPADTQAPTAPLNLTANPVSPSQINLSWSPSTDNVAVTGYQIFRNDVKAATIATTSYGDTGLTASTTYSYNIRAIDGAGNVSGPSNTISVTTLPASITTGNITGTVYSSGDGVLSGVRISIKVGKSNKTYLTDSKGAFNIINIPPGTYSLSFKKTGYIAQNININVTSGTTRTITVTLIKR